MTIRGIGSSDASTLTIDYGETDSQIDLGSGTFDIAGQIILTPF